MRIAMVFDSMNIGGITRVGVDYISIMHELGFEVDVYNLDPSRREMEIEVPSDCKIYHKKFSKFLCPELYSYGVKKWWWGKYAYPLIDIILVLLKTINKLTTRLKYSREYDVSIAFSGHFADLTFVADNFIKSKKKLCWLHGALAEYLLIASGFGTLYKKIKNLTVLSTELQDLAINSNKFLAELNIKKIYNPTKIGDKPIDSRKIEELKSKHGDFLLMVGRFTKQKDQKTVVKAIQILKQRYHREQKIIFVGDGEDLLKVKAYSTDLGVDNLTVFEGARMDVQNYYAAAYAFVHSSPSEGLPTVLIESLYFRLPIVATNSFPGVNEILNNERYGLTCSVRDADALASQINKLLEDKDLYAFYQRQSLEKIQDFDSRLIKTKLLEELQSLV